MSNTLSSAVLALMTGTASVEGTAYGIIESVREVLLETVAGGLGGLIEHPARPGDELIVRLDDGRAVTVVQCDLQDFQPGERVVLLAAGRGKRVERAPH